MRLCLTAANGEGFCALFGSGTTFDRCQCFQTVIGWLMLSRLLIGNVLRQVSTWSTWSINSSSRQRVALSAIWSSLCSISQRANDPGFLTFGFVGTGLIERVGSADTQGASDSNPILPFVASNQTLGCLARLSNDLVIGWMGCTVQPTLFNDRCSLTRTDVGCEIISITFFVLGPCWRLVVRGM